MKKTIYNDGDVLPIGMKQGCFTIVAGFEAYQQEIAKDLIAKLEEDKQKFIDGEECTWFKLENMEMYDQRIAFEKERQVYKIQCKCGKIYFRTSQVILKQRWRNCGEDCGIKKQKEAEMLASYPRIQSPSYNYEFINNTHETLEIIECLDDWVETEPVIYDKRKKGAGKVSLLKKYLCKCHLCGKEYEFLSNQFEIKNDSYGSNADKGYYCEAYCDCHYISSFQWRTIKILTEHKVAYKAEVSFPDLLSEKGNNLRFDFAILNPDSSIKCFIECQGKQHFEIGHGFRGYDSLHKRQKHDELKREYAKKSNIQLIEITYTYNTYEKEEKYLIEQGVI